MEETQETIIETDKCKVVLKEEKVIAKCGAEEIDLGDVSKPEITAESVKEECPECAEAVAVGWAIKYIRDLNPQVADQILDEVTEDKITSEDALDKCVHVAEEHGKKDLVDTIKHLKDMLHKPL